MSKKIFFNILILLILFPFQNCSSKMQGLSDLTSGATTSLSQSQIPVTLQFTQTPSASTTEPSAQFIFSPTNTGSGIVSTQCSLDGAAYTNCISPLTLLNLSAANHQFSVQAKDSSGNLATLNYAWIVLPMAIAPPPVSLMKTIFFAVGHGGRTLMSCDDGLSWINDRSDIGADVGDHSPTSSHGMDAGNGYLYANYGWGFNGTLRRSRDGVNWTTIHDGNWGGGVAAGKDFLFNATEGGIWSTSTNNGTDWLQIKNLETDNVIAQLVHLNVTRLNDKIFITSSDQKLAISYDQGRTWVLLANPGFLGNTGARYFAEGNGAVISVSYEEGTFQGNVSRSTDNGKTWTLVKMGGIWSPPIFNGSQFIAWSGGKTWFSSDGLNWSNVITKLDGQDAPPFWETATAYNSKTGTFIAILSGWNQENANQKAYRSKDGINWTSLDATKFKGGNSVKRARIGEIETKYCP